MKVRFQSSVGCVAETGANTVRLYNVDPKNNHTKFMEKAANSSVRLVSVY